MYIVYLWMQCIYFDIDRNVCHAVIGVCIPIVLVLGASTLIIWSMLVSFLGIDRMPTLLQHEITNEGNGDWFFVCIEMCISVVIVACPCALGLATSTAVMVGTTLVAEHGVVFKGSAVLETGQKVNKIVFDKTGTLTIGKDQQEATRRQMLILSGLAESYREYLLGCAIISKAKSITKAPLDMALDHLGTVSNFNYETGLGIECDVLQQEKGHRAVIGNQKWLEECHVSLDGVATGYISISDMIKPEAKLVIDTLHMMGVDIAMVTGDNALAVKGIAVKVGITEVHSGVSPNGKTQIVRNMQVKIIYKAGFFGYHILPTVVAMVGDGINDSPALVTANLGIALCYHLHPMMASIAIAASSAGLVVSSLMLRWFWRKPRMYQEDEKK
ncbi:HAD-like domain-containing protein [Thamnidium elegans]|nr:HAD-like domain-containing protein [Thamnidium elegans]